MINGPMREILVKGLSRNDLLAKQARDTSAEILSNLNLVLPDKIIKEERQDRNVFSLASGDFSIGSLSATITMISAVGDARIVTPVTVSSQCAIFNNVSFVGDGDYLVKVKNGATVVFNGCTFERSRLAKASNSTSDDLCYVLVNETGTVNFMGCAFLRGPSFAGYVVINEGPDDSNVKLFGCVNLTGTEI